MIVTVKVLEKCFYGKLIRGVGERFSWKVPEEYLKKAADESKQLKDVMPSYLELVSNAPEIKPSLEKETSDSMTLDSITGDHGGTTGSVDVSGIDDGNSIDSEKIKQALAELDHNDDSLWTDTGELRLIVLKDKLGYRVNRAELEEIAPGFKRQGA